jgi:head-tail adaptor
MAAGELRELVALEEFAEVDDGRGNITAAWTERARCAARIQYLRGSEAVMQSRLQGKQPIAITVRRTPAVMDATTAWRARDLRAPNDAQGNPTGLWQIRSISPAERHDYVDFLCERGVVT